MVNLGGGKDLRASGRIRACVSQPIYATSPINVTYYGLKVNKKAPEGAFLLLPIPENLKQMDTIQNFCLRET